MKFLSYLLLLSSVLLAACESLVSDIDPSDLPQVDSKLVVQCFISPQAARTSVVVTESTPLFGEGTTNGGLISKARVSITDGTNEARLPFDTVSQLYTIEKSLFPIVAGKTYYLTVTDGKRTVTSSCTVPAKAIGPKSYVVDTTYQGSVAQQDTIITVKLTWDDIRGEANYYRARAYMDLEYSVPDGTNPNNFDEKRTRTRFNFNWDDTIGRNDYFSDANLDGEAFSTPIGRVNLPDAVSYDFGNGNRYTVYPKSEIISVTMEIYNTDEHYFRYHRSLETRGSSDNPFVEPSLIYTNIEGGLGCFAAYNAGQVVYRPK